MLQKCRDKFSKGGFSGQIGAIGRKVNTRKHDFAVAGGAYPFRFIDDSAQSYTS